MTQRLSLQTRLALLLFLSAFSALTYQIVWIRMLGLSFGISALAVSASVAAFFLGMGIGSSLTRRLQRRGMATLKSFALVELITGSAAMLLIPLLMNLDTLVAVAPLTFQSTEFKFAVAMLLLLIPTACIGITYPLMTIIATRHEREIGQRLSILYTMNTLGAVVGAVAAGFLLIPELGMRNSVYLAAAINFSVAATAFVQRHKGHSATALTPWEDRASELHSGPPLLLLVIAVTGYVSLSAEIIWVKYVTVINGGTLHSYSALIAAILLGIACGSFLYSRLVNRGSPSLYHLSWGMLLLAGALLMNRLSLWGLPLTGWRFLARSESGDYLLQFVTLFTLLFPTTLLLGALFPLTLRLYCHNLCSLQRQLGRAYAINTLFAVAGSAITALWVIPKLGSDGALLLLIGLTLAMAFMVALQPAARFRPSRLGSVLFMLLIAAPLLPGIDYDEVVLASDSWNKLYYRNQFTFSREGRKGLVTILDNQNGIVYLQNDGLSEAGITENDPRRGTPTATLLALLPYALHQGPKNAFVIGLGGGTTAKLLHSSGLQSLHIAELEPVVVDALHSIDKDNYSFLHSDTVTLEYNDARNSLLTHATGYDLIISQPSHPWLSGMGNLFSSEFYQLARQRLNPGGVYAQWINMTASDLDVIKSQMFTFYREFSHGVAFVHWKHGEIILLGSDRELVLDYNTVATLMDQPDMAVAMQHIGISSPNDLLQYYLFSRYTALQFSAGATLNTDDNLYAELRLARLRHNPVEPWPVEQALRQQSVTDLAGVRVEE